MGKTGWGLFFAAGAILAPASAGAGGPQVPPVEEILRSAPGPSGVCVVVGCGDANLVVGLGEKSAFLVHANDRDEAKVKACRQAAEGRGLYGRVAAETRSPASLPYADKLADLVVVEDAGDLAEAELMRVLAPRGAAWVRRGGAWEMRRAPLPGTYGAWTHARHGADGNVVSRDREVAAPAGLRWVAGAPQYGAPEWKFSVEIMVSANGRNFYVYKDKIEARNAFNGILLWTQPFQIQTFQERDAEKKVVVRSHRVYPVAAGDTLFAVSGGKLVAYDGAAGRAGPEIATVRDPREILVEGGLLVVSDGGGLRAYDAGARKLAWESKVLARRIVAGEGALFCLAGAEVLCLDLSSGRERWRMNDEDAAQALTCACHGGVLALEKASLKDDPGCSGLAVYSARDGKRLWKKGYDPAMGHVKTARAIFAQGLLWIHAFEAKRAVLLGLDPLTGEERRRWGSDREGGRCAPPMASERFFIAPECDFTDFETGRLAKAGMIKNTCGFPFVPANGLLYTFPNHCVCFAMLRGYMGLAPGPQHGVESPPLLRPASKVPDAPKPGPAGAAPGDDWPMYRHDVHRSGGTPCRLKRADLKPLWEAKVAPPPEGPLAEEWGANPFVRGPVTPPVAARGWVVVAVPDRHRVEALDAETGRPRWNYTAGGRIDGPPTLHEGLVLFGAHDGWVYALDAADGSLAWKFRAAPRDGRVVAYGQMESPWPVPASVLVEQDVAFFAAGRHPLADGGVQVCAVRAKTGDLVWKRAISEVPPKGAWEGLSLVDILARDGGRLSMSRWRFDPASGDVEFVPRNADFEASGGKRIPRGLWGYGIRQIRWLEGKAPAAFDGDGMFTGEKGDVAVLLAGGVRLSATAAGDLKVGDRTLALGAPPVPDGMIVARGRLYVSTQKGTVLCLE